MSESYDTGSGRPFPWTCPRCRKKAVWRRTLSYQCQRRHNGQQITVCVPSLNVPQCSECGELVFDYVAEAQINDAYRAVIQTGETTSGSPPLTDLTTRQPASETI